MIGFVFSLYPLHILSCECCKPAYTQGPQLTPYCLQPRAKGLKGLPGGSAGKGCPCSAGDLDSISKLGRSPGEGKGYHSSILAWRIPWTIQSMGSQRVRHDWVTFTHSHNTYLGDGRGIGGCGVHLSPQMHQDTHSDRSACRTPAESGQNLLTTSKEYIEPCITWQDEGSRG